MSIRRRRPRGQLLAPSESSRPGPRRRAPETSVPRGADADRAVLELAARQDGVVTTQQLAAAGLDRSAVFRRVERGWLRRLHRGVYLVGPLPLPLSLERAAVLACGPSALLSHATAAALWGLLPTAGGPVHVTAERRVRHPGLRVHSSATFAVADVAACRGLPVTSPARTLLDVAAGLSSHELDRAIEEALVRRVATRAELLAVAVRAAGHRGAGVLQRAVERLHEPAMTRSGAERRLLRLIRSARLPRRRVNTRLRGYEVDFHWPDADLVVEVDGFAYHSGRHAFERDRRRDADLGSAGTRVLRVTYRQIIEEPEAVIAHIAGALAARRRAH